MSTPIMAITTNSSINVNPDRNRRIDDPFLTVGERNVADGPIAERNPDEVRRQPRTLLAVVEILRFGLVKSPSKSGKERGKSADWFQLCVAPLNISLGA